MATIVLAGTFDSKGLEYVFVRNKITSTYPKCRVILIDIGYIQDPDPNVIVPDIRSAEVALKAGCESIETLRSGDRDAGYRLMTNGLKLILKEMLDKGEMHGLLGLGGTCGSSMLTAVMHELPIGIPKVMISTAASTPASLKYHGLVDLTLINCVTDIFGGVNRFNSRLMANGAVAIAAMALDYWETNHAASSVTCSIPQNSAPVIAVSMMGAVMPCVKVVHKHLTDLGYEVVIFCAIGFGGRLMEKLISEGRINGVLDITLMELTGEYLGGTFTAGPNRLEQAALTGIPQVVSLAGLDFVPLGPYDEVVKKFPDRKLYRHNEQITAMRTSPDECNKLAVIIGEKLNKAKGPCCVYIPKGGLSTASKVGAVFYDPKADEVLFDTLKTTLNPNVVQIIEIEDDLNSEKFAIAMATTLHLQMCDAMKST